MSEINENRPEYQPETQNPLVGKSFVHGMVTIDAGQWLTDLENDIKKANPQTDKEKIDLANLLVKSRFKDALNPSKYPDYSEDNFAQNKAISEAIYSSAKMSEVVAGEFAVCRQYNTYGLVALEIMKVEAVLASNPDYNHIFLYAKKDSVWKPQDPFAQEYFKNKTGTESLFPDNCYAGISVDLVGKTTLVKDTPRSLFNQLCEQNPYKAPPRR